MNSTLLNTAMPYTVTVAAGLVMVQLGSVWGRVESRYRARWCTSCHRRITGRICSCARER